MPKWLKVRTVWYRVFLASGRVSAEFEAAMVEHCRDNAGDHSEDRTEIPQWAATHVMLFIRDLMIAAHWWLDQRGIVEGIDAVPLRSAETARDFPFRANDHLGQILRVVRKLARGTTTDS